METSRITLRQEDKTTTTVFATLSEVSAMSCKSSTLPIGAETSERVAKTVVVVLSSWRRVILLVSIYDDRTQGSFPFYVMQDFLIVNR